jgi:hypothetical protein
LSLPQPSTQGLLEKPWDPGWVFLVRNFWDLDSFQQCLEGKPHFKRWGMSWTRLPLAQWADQEKRNKPTIDKRKRNRSHRGIKEQRPRPTAFFFFWFPFKTAFALLSSLLYL